MTAVRSYATVWVRKPEVSTAIASAQGKLEAILGYLRTKGDIADLQVQNQLVYDPEVKQWIFLISYSYMHEEFVS
jgi:hypothetical protein